MQPWNTNRWGFSSSLYSHSQINKSTARYFPGVAGLLQLEISRPCWAWYFLLFLDSVLSRCWWGVRKEPWLPSPCWLVRQDRWRIASAWQMKPSASLPNTWIITYMQMDFECIISQQAYSQNWNMKANVTSAWKSVHSLCSRATYTWQRKIYKYNEM